MGIRNCRSHATHRHAPQRLSFPSGAGLVVKPTGREQCDCAKTPEQLSDNLGATKLELATEDLQALEDVSQLPLEYPGWMIERQGQYRAKPPVRS